MRPVVLVEGHSDRIALETLARREGRDLTGPGGVDLVAMGGITNARAFVLRLVPTGVRLAGLYDAAEEGYVRRALVAGGLAGPDDDPAASGFHRCVADLEDELIRALGIDAVEAVIDAAGETRSLRLLAQMPAQRGWDRVALVRRFLTSRSGRKAQYARLLVEALDPARVPAPLTAVLDAGMIQPSTSVGSA